MLLLVNEKSVLLYSKDFADTYNTLIINKLIRTNFAASRKLI